MIIPKPLRKLKKVQKMYHKQNEHCPLCGQLLINEMKEYEDWIMSHINHIPPQKTRSRININYDHIIPLSKGGKDKKSNKQLVHALCNSIKGNRLDVDNLVVN